VNPFKRVIKQLRLSPELLLLALRPGPLATDDVVLDMIETFTPTTFPGG
jgi:hypothetical protein